MRATTATFSKVAVLGAAGGIGQPLSLLLKQNPLVGDLRLYDVKGAPGVAADVSHMSTRAKVRGFAPDELSTALEGADLVIIPAGVPRKPGMSRDDLFNTNAGIVRDLAAACAKSCPKAIIGIISNPVNSTVPIAAETLRKAGAYDPRKLFGVTTLDLVRARTFVAEALNKDPRDIEVPVIGGHSGETIVPLLSSFGLTEEQIKALTHRIQFGGDEVVKAKAGAGSATLSMAYAGSVWANHILRGLSGDKNVVYTFIENSQVDSSCSYFSSGVEVGKEGVERPLPLPKLSKYETDLLAVCVEKLSGNIAKGVKFGTQ